MYDRYWREWKETNPETMMNGAVREMIRLSRLMRNSTKLLIIVSLLLAITLLIDVACERYFDLVIENKTTQILTVYMDNYAIGTVEQGKRIVNQKVPGNASPFLIVAKNAQGEIVFSKTLRVSEMEQIGKNIFKVVIPVKSP